MSDSDRRARGRAMFEEVMRFPAPEQQEGDLFFDQTLDHLFADVWARKALSVRERRLITLTVLACLGNESPLALHLNAAMKSGFTDEQIDEILLHITHYAGWPVGAVAFGVARRRQAERDAGS